jgi:hypothetical protein
MSELESEASKLTDILRGKAVNVIKRHRPGEIMIEFEDGSRLFVNRASTGLEFSVTDRRMD